MNSKILILCFLIGVLNAEEAAISHQDVKVYVNNEVIAARPLHLSIVTHLVESEIIKTDNYKMKDPTRNQPCVRVTWNHKAMITVHAATGDKDVEITKVDFRDFGPGASDIGDIVIMCSDAENNVYHCEKYSPQFCDAVHSILHFKVAK